jgi:hypothetical protein
VAAWWGSPGGRGILPAARRRGCATAGPEVGRPCLRRERSSGRGVVLPGGMRAPPGESGYRKLRWSRCDQSVGEEQQLPAVCCVGDGRAERPAETDVKQAGRLGASFSYPHRRQQSQTAGLGNSACV